MNKHLPPIQIAPLINEFCEWPLWSASIAIEALFAAAYEIFENKGQLLTLWGSDERMHESGFCLHLLFIFLDKGMVYLQCNLSEDNPVYPDLSTLFPVANRLQRAISDLMGFKVENSCDLRPWLRHNAWPSNLFPLRHEIKITDQFPPGSDDYSFIRVGGSGVHEIPVGPVHAGIIEPGNFHFQVVGERILRLEERLGYTHKGIAKHFQLASYSKGAKLASRISGDSTVAYAWAYSMAIENLHQQTIPPRAHWLRALFLERERLANHLGDLGALGNDAGFAFGLTQFSRLKENVLRVNAQCFKHRYLMDLIIPGGVIMELTVDNIDVLHEEIRILETEVNLLHAIYAKHDGLQDRFSTTGIVTPELAQKLGLVGLVARASNQWIDARIHMQHAPYTELDVDRCVESTGDVAARVLLRFSEIKKSLKLLEDILKKIPKGAINQALPKMTTSRIGIGCVEGWRGPVVFAVCNEDDQRIRWAHMHDPSWQNWPALEHAVIGNIVPDFPLINKSFNLSYSGHDS